MEAKIDHRLDELYLKILANAVKDGQLTEEEAQQLSKEEN